MNIAPRRPSPSGLPSHGLWSLWEMWNLLIGPFHKQLETLFVIEDVLKDGTPLDQPLIEKIVSTLERLKKSCAELKLDQSCHHMDRILEKLKRGTTSAYLVIQMDDLRAGIEFEAKDDVVFIVERDRAKYLGLSSEGIFWKPACDLFPSAESDMFSAAACYAFDQPTASVFHSMRILEIGLRAFAESLGLPFGTDVWHVVLDQIEATIRGLERDWPKSTNKTEFLKFYSTAAKEFRYFKDGWRNYVSHNFNEYDAPQALSVLNHVRDFMAELSSRLSEV